MKKAKTIIYFLILSIAIFGWIENSQAATLIYSENFDDQTVDNLNSGSVSANVTINRDSTSAAIYDTDYIWGTGRGSSGYCLSDKAGGVGTAFLLLFPFSGTWTSNEFYVSFWERFADFTSTDSMENIKTFYTRWNGANGYVHFSMGSPSGMFYSARSSDGVTMLPVSTNYPGTGGVTLTDGNWHHLEFWVKFDTAQVRYWVDSALILDDNYNDSLAAWTNALYWMRIPAEDAEEVGTFTRQVDDVNVWDGMPDGDTTPPAVPSGLSVQ